MVFLVKYSVEWETTIKLGRKEAARNLTEGFV